MGAVGAERGRRFAAKMAALGEARRRLAELRMTPPALKRHGIAVNEDGISRNAAELLAYPGVDLARLAAVWPELGSLSPEIAEQLEIDARYAGYLERQERDIASFRRDEALLLPADLDYWAVGSLSREISGKLAVARPATLGAAARISGVTPAALVALLKHVRRREDDTLTHQAHSVLVPPLPQCGRGANEPISLQPLSRTAGEGAERSEAGEDHAA